MFVAVAGLVVGVLGLVYVRRRGSRKRAEMTPAR